jgi:hypothetical protein
MAQVLNSVKGFDNTFNYSPKWARTLPLGILQEISIEIPLISMWKFKTPFRA